MHQPVGQLLTYSGMPPLPPAADGQLPVQQSLPNLAAMQQRQASPTGAALREGARCMSPARPSFVGAAQVASMPTPSRSPSPQARHMSPMAARRLAYATSASLPSSATPGMPRSFAWPALGPPPGSHAATGPLGLPVIPGLPAPSGPPGPASGGALSWQPPMPPPGVQNQRREGPTWTGASTATTVCLQPGFGPGPPPVPSPPGSPGHLEHLGGNILAAPFAFFAPPSEPPSTAGGATAAALLGMLTQRAAASCSAAASAAGVAAEWSAMANVPSSSERGASGVHLLFPGVADGVVDKEGILERCYDTTRLVSQLASVLKGLEADVHNLRQENRNLRKTACASAAIELARQQNSPESTGFACAETVPATGCAATWQFQEQQELDRRSISGEVAPVAACAADTNAYGQPAVPDFSATPQASGQNLHLSTPLAVVAVTSPAQMSHQRVAANPQQPNQDRPTKDRAGSPARTPQVATPSSSSTAGGAPAGLARTPPTRPAGTAGAIAAGGSGPQPIVPRQVQNGQGQPGTAADCTGSPGSARTDPSAYVEVTFKPSAAVAQAAQAAQAAAQPADEAEPCSSGAGLRGEAARREPGAVPGPWAAEQSIWLGSEVLAERLLANRVLMLDREVVCSATSAADGLNRGAFKCPTDVCAVFSSSSKGYLLLYKMGCKDRACAAAAAARVPYTEEPIDIALPTTSTAVGGCGAGTAIVVPGPQRDGRGDEQEAQQLGALSGPQDFQPVTELASKDALARLEELASRGEASKAEELLVQYLRSGFRPTEACFDVVIAALDRDRKTARAEDWLWRALEAAMVPSEASFKCVVVGACREGAPQKVEHTMLQMMRLRIRPSKEIFDEVIRLFASRREAAKVEEWLLNAGQSGWTPEQAAFEAAVGLFAEVDAVKAEEWLSRAQQTEYHMPDNSFSAVVQAFARAGRLDKATDRLSRMLQEGRSPTEASIHEVVVALANTGDVQLAEAWLAQLVGRGGAAAVDGLRRTVFDAALRMGEAGCAEQQLTLLAEPDAERTHHLVALLAERGEARSAHRLLQHHYTLGGQPTPELNAMLQSICALLDAPGGGEVASLHAAAGGEGADSMLAEEDIMPHAGELGASAAAEVMAEQEAAPGRDRASAAEAAPSNSQVLRPSQVGGAKRVSSASAAAAAGPAAGSRQTLAKAAKPPVVRRGPAGATGPRRAPVTAR